MYKQDLFKDKVALVTGGRSGIGFGIAKKFLELGASVFICSRNEEKLIKAAQELNQIGPCAFMPCDIRQEEQLKEMSRAIMDTYGRLDILVNNAGGQFPALAEHMSLKGWNAVINNNLNGTFYAIQQMANTFFIPQKEGIIVNIIANTVRGFPGMAHTGAARAGVENLTKTLAQEWARFNIRCNAIAPGIIVSSGLDQYGTFVQGLLEKAKEEILMHRLGTIEDVANAVCFYASPLSSYVSGTTLYVDGTEHLHGNRMSMVELFVKMTEK